MRDTFWLRVFAISVALVIVVSCTAVLYNSTEVGKGIEEGEGKDVISLMPPPFIGVAGAAEATGSNAFPEDEAGMSAYVNIGHEIDLEKAKGVFFSVEDESENGTYIIGQVALDSFGKEKVSPHVYVTSDGWIVAYFLKSEESSKIMPWFKYTEPITDTTLGEAIHKVCDAILLKYDYIKGDVTYYNFKFPEANKLMLIVDKTPTGEKVSGYFELTVPTECTLYEASWSNYVSDGGSKVEITDEDNYPVWEISNIRARPGYNYGKFTAEQLSADNSLRKITVSTTSGGRYTQSGVAISLVYHTK